MAGKSESGASGSRLKISTRTVNKHRGDCVHVAPDTGQPVPEGIWVCRCCESLNEGESGNCAVCGASKF